MAVDDHLLHVVTEAAIAATARQTSFSASYAVTREAERGDDVVVEELGDASKSPASPASSHLSSNDDSATGTYAGASAAGSSASSMPIAPSGVRPPPRPASALDCDEPHGECREDVVVDASPTTRSR